ncbi:vWA domain-containing protein [Paenibacillus paridis]|uniref:vWA domain-containing protein n=1 Tax=Paenibacillus paridis TaxID=2583376 RepID=UPI00192E36BD|nr:vWA domain-containing protein [Paenibacillus paridis]
MQRKINLLLLLFSLIGGAIGFAIGEVILGSLLGTWPRFAVVGLYFGVLALCIGLFCLIAELITPRLNGNSWRQRYTDLSWKLLVPATLVLLFIVGGLLQLLYGLHLGGAKQVKDIVLVIDNSGSMLETDPDNERYTAAKQLIDNMDDDKRVAIVMFSNTAELLLPFVNVSSQEKKNEIHAAIDAIEPTDGGTDFRLALSEAMKTIQGETGFARGTMVILLSDGFSESSINQQIEDYKEQQIVINTVGLSVVDTRGSALLQQIADATGGSYYDVTEANGVSLVFQNIYKKLDNRTLLTERKGTLEDSTLYMLLRILAFALIGAAIGVSLGLVFDNRFLALSFGAGGIVGGIAAGYILDYGLSGHDFTDGFWRFIAALVLAAVIGLFTLIVPIRENSGTKSRGGGRKGSGSALPSAGMGGRSKDSRSHGF